MFFDAENVPSKKVPDIIDFLSAKGDILFQRAYADWSISSTKSWQDQITRTPIAAIQQFHHNQEQAVDKAVMMDAIELAIKHDDIDIFALIASDNGYYSLALRLRELGKKVIGIGEKSKSKDIWVNSCNEFTYFEDLEDSGEDILKSFETAEDNDEMKDFALESLLERAFDSTPLYKETNTVLLTRMWQSLLRIKPDFNVRKYGKKTAKEFIQSFSDKFNLTDDGRPQQTVFVEKNETKHSLRKNGSIKQIGSYYGFIASNNDAGDYFFYTKDINPEYKKSVLNEGMKVDFLVIKEPNLLGKNTKEKNGRAEDIVILEKNISS